MLLWCLKSRELERWRREEAEARRSRRGEECIRPLAAANWRPERPQPHHQEEEEERQKGGVGATGDDVSMGPQPGTTYICNTLSEMVNLQTDLRQMLFLF